MTLEENVRQANSDFVAIKEKIVECGVEVAEGTHTREYAPKVVQVYEAGKKSQYDEFWDGIQDHGNRSNYHYGFTYWKSTNITPKYTIISNTLYGLCYGCHNLEELPPFESLYEAGFDSAMMAFMNCARLKKVPPFKIRVAGVTALNNTFNGCRALEIIEELAFAAGEYAFLDTFKQCTALVNLTLEGTIQSNGLNLQWSTLLSKASIISVINALSTTTSGLAVTLSKTAVESAFEPAEWTTLIGTRSNWTINLV